ncbi:MAG: hypothetical protein IJ578_05650 [Bacteroidales bacterium]|nr:hypothetical protein [Bacteroidales bacterium]
MIKKTISTARERYDAPVCEELNVRIEQSILSTKQPGDPDIDGDEDLGNI